LWDHSVEATQLAHNICKGLPQVSKEEVTLAALVHDIGKLVLHGLGSEFQKKKNELLGEGISPLEAEAILCGFTHAEVGRDFLLSWSFPPDLAAAVSHHHDSSFAGNTFADILYLTELITKDDVLPSESDRAEQCCDRLGLEFKLFSVKGLVADPALSMLRFEAAA
jgi:putative nucleotidyltransferase with HDIG domain